MFRTEIGTEAASILRGTTNTHQGTTEATAGTDPERNLDQEIDHETGIEAIAGEIHLAVVTETAASEVRIDREETAKVALRLATEGTRMISTI